MIDERDGASVLSLPPLPSPLHLLARRARVARRCRLSERLSVVARRRLRFAADAAAATAAQTVRDWLIAQRANRHGSVEMLWEPLALAALNQSVDVADAGSFLAVLQRMFGPEPDAATLLLPAVPLDDLYAHPPPRTSRDPDRVSAAHSLGARALRWRSRDRRAWCATNASARPRSSRQSRGLRLPICSNRRRRRCTPTLANAAGAGQLADRDGESVARQRPSARRRFSSACRARTSSGRSIARAIAGPSQSSISLVSSGAEAICARDNEALVDLARRELGGALPAAARGGRAACSVVRERRATFSLAPGSPPRPATATPVDGLVSRRRLD